MQIQNAYLTHNRPRTIRKQTTAIAVHWVANPGSSAMANRNYFNSTSRSVSSNYIVGLQGEVICCIPDEEMSWCTNAANSYTVSIETCHPDWTGAFGSRTYASLVELTAQLCRKYGLHPQHGGVIRHYDVTGRFPGRSFRRAKAARLADGRTGSSDVANAMGNGNAVHLHRQRQRLPQGIKGHGRCPAHPQRKRHVLSGGWYPGQGRYTIVETKVTGAGWKSGAG
ncbi:MAG: N-acetylmuramoyl-L-alanine amidase family protein [Ruminococcus sp.]